MNHRIGAITDFSQYDHILWENKCQSAAMATSEQFFFNLSCLTSQTQCSYYCQRQNFIKYTLMVHSWNQKKEMHIEALFCSFF